MWPYLHAKTSKPSNNLLFLRSQWVRLQPAASGRGREHRPLLPLETSLLHTENQTRCYPLEWRFGSMLAVGQTRGSPGRKHRKFRVSYFKFSLVCVRTHFKRKILSWKSRVAWAGFTTGFSGKKHDFGSFINMSTNFLKYVIWGLCASFINCSFYCDEESSQL